MVSDSSRACLAMFFVLGATACRDAVVVQSGASGSTGIGGASASGSATTSVSSGSGTGPPPPSTTCTLTTLATGLDRPANVMAGSGVVYFQQSGPTASGLFRVPVSGGAPTPVLSSQGINVGTLGLVRADAARVVWAAGDGSVQAMPATGGATVILAPAGSPALTAMTLGSDSVYAGTTAGSIVRIPFGGGGETTLMQAAAKNVAAIAVDGAHVIWVDAANDAFWANVVRSMPLSGGIPHELAHFDDAKSRLSVYGGAAFVANGGTLSFGAPSGQEGGDGSVLMAPLAGGAPETVIWGGADTQGIAANATGVYWGGGSILYGAMAPAVQPAPIERISANGVWETISAESVIDSMVECEGGVCWPDALAGTVVRAVCAAVAPAITTPAPEPPACTTFCDAMGGCSRAACHETCKALLAAPCANEGAALAACLAAHLDQLTCQAKGCDAETMTLSECRSAPPPVMPFSGGGGSSGPAGTRCHLEGWDARGEHRAVCEAASTDASCTCYLDLTPIGTCAEQVPSSPPAAALCQAPVQCCAAVLGNAATQY